MRSVDKGSITVRSRVNALGTLLMLVVSGASQLRGDLLASSQN